MLVVVLWNSKDIPNPKTEVIPRNMKLPILNKKLVSNTWTT
jgi:hypothetical protein